MRKCVVTPKGMKHVKLTAAEVKKREEEEQAEANRPPRPPRFEEQAKGVEAAKDIEEVKAAVASALRKLA